MGIYNRREFLLQLMYGGAGAYIWSRASLPGISSSLGTNDRLRVGIVGFGAKGLNHLDNFVQIPGVEVCAVCDLDSSNLRTARAVFQRRRLPAPITTVEYRRLVDLRDLDAVSIAVTKTKRVGIAMDFCSAGKDILIERPFSASAREGKQLVKAAEDSGRVVQQKDDAFLFSLAEEPSSAAFAALGGVAHVQARRSVFRVGDGPFGSQCSLADEGWRELDMARCILGGEVPARVSTVGIGSANGANQKIMVDVEFRHHAQPRRIQLEVAEVNTHGNVGHLSHIASVNHYIGPKGRLVISTDFDQERLAEKISFRNFVDCVRERKPDQLLNHIGEARKSNFLAELAAYSLNEHKHLDVDPISEDVVGFQA